jgi:SAM-dependent methyltransferase
MSVNGVTLEVCSKLGDGAARDASKCRICGSGSILKCGQAEFYFGYFWPIYDCETCGCRFTLHDPSVFELFYSERNARYREYFELSEIAGAFFVRGDTAALKAMLSKTEKYRFIIDQISAEPTATRLLEIGCSSGFLTSYFILQGREIVGVDASRQAVRTAARAFGDHFVVAGDARIRAEAPYDFIYHVGTIGCVADPIGMTQELLAMLKCGGRLLFNAPNRGACVLRDQLWLSAPPPDVVTMYKPGFWRQYFGDVAEVNERVDYEASPQNLIMACRKLVGRRWRMPVPMPLIDNTPAATAPLDWSSLAWRNIERIVHHVGSWTGANRFAPRNPAEYGLFVSMIKR